MRTPLIIATARKAELDATSGPQRSSLASARARLATAEALALTNGAAGDELAEASGVATRE